MGKGLAEGMNELAKTVVVVAETRSGLLLRETIDEDTAEGLVLPLTSRDRLQEEVAKDRVVHGQAPTV